MRGSQRRSLRRNRGVLVAAVTALVLGLAGYGAASARTPAASTPPPYPCAPNGPAGGQTIYGTFGDAGLIGWAGNSQGVVECLGGSFYVIASGAPNSGSTAPVTGTTYGFGIYDDSRTTWRMADGYLPALITGFRRGGADISITNFGDEVMIGGHNYVNVYSRVRVHNATGKTIHVDPAPSAGFAALTPSSTTVAAHATVDHDYVVPADRFGGTYAYPSAAELKAAGGYAKHYTHMRNYWDGQLSKIAEPRQLPDPSLINAYRSGYVYTQIIRAGSHLKTGINGYDTEFSHDVIGILANLFNQGSFGGAHALLDRARRVTGTQSQYSDGVWTYAWPWAIYLQKTGDLAFVKSHFDTEGPGGTKDPSIKDTAHEIAAQRTGPGGIMAETNDIDANGFWTIDNYEALTGLASYRYLAQKVGDSTEASWALNEYNSLLAATNKTLRATIADNHLNYLPCSMVQPNTDNRCSNPEDANWGAPFLFGRWAWDGYLFGADINGPGSSLIDRTYDYGFGRLSGKLPHNTLGGYPPYFFSTAYNAGYGEWGLASQAHRTQGILGYQFMVGSGQSGPNAWWESQAQPNTGNPWIGTHPAAGNGSAPHAWGIANANLVLLDSLVAERSNGQVVIGRGVPNGWLAPHKTISVNNVPLGQSRRMGLRITSSGRVVHLVLTGSKPTGKVLFQLPGFVRNIASTTAGTVGQAGGTVVLDPSVRSVTVTLRHAVAG
jgi:hypothetical protein